MRIPSVLLNDDMIDTCHAMDLSALGSNRMVWIGNNWLLPTYSFSVTLVAKNLAPIGSKGCGTLGTLVYASGGMAGTYVCQPMCEPFHKCQLIYKEEFHVFNIEGMMIAATYQCECPNACRSTLIGLGLGSAENGATLELCEIYSYIWEWCDFVGFCLHSTLWMTCRYDRWQQTWF